MCSLFDYIANKLSKDKNVELSVNIDELPIRGTAQTNNNKTKLSHLRKHEFLFSLVGYVTVSMFNTSSKRVSKTTKQVFLYLAQ